MFLDWEEAGAPRENPPTHRENCMLGIFLLVGTGRDLESVFIGMGRESSCC